MKLHDTKSGERREFTPRPNEPVTMYVCGPTVYDTPHIGNARPVIVFDLLARLLRRDHRVVYARNYTDVDDKIIARAREREITITDLCDNTIAQYEAAMSRIGVEEPDLKPRATENIPAMVAMIERLLDGGHAYQAEGHVLFDTTRYPQGVLTGQQGGRDRPRIDTADYKRNQADFVLWKPADGGVGWDSVIGRGRPGWHIECSAMIAQHLGETIDIHGGGQDLIFPHHEAECAQSECAHGRDLARFWVHNAMVLSDGTKMAKSSGNFVTVDQVTDAYRGDVLRFAMLQTHYRHPFDFRWDRIQQASAALRRLTLRGEQARRRDPVDEAFLAALNDDLNTPEAMARLHAMPDSALLASLAVMGFKPERERAPAEVQELLDRRAEARRDRDFALSDQLRDELGSMGVVVEDNALGTSWRWR
jgi:cysteinyl-tRNA synthetase